MIMFFFVFLRSVLPTPIFYVPIIILSYLIVYFYSISNFSLSASFCAYLVTLADLALIWGGLNVKEILTLCEFVCPYINYKKIGVKELSVEARLFSIH